MYEEEHEAPPARGGGGFGRAVKNLFLFLLFAALAFAALYLVAERNARRYYLVPEEGTLVVKRGIFFPIGEKPYLPDDPRMAEAYAPVPIPPGEAALGKQDFEEREDLNYALFDILLSWARPRIEGGDNDRLETGIRYLGRAERLPVYDPGRRQALDDLRAEVAWYEARRLLDASVEALGQAAAKLSHAREADGPKAEESAALLRHLRREMATLKSLQRAVAEVSEGPAEGRPARTGPPAHEEAQAPVGAPGQPEESTAAEPDAGIGGPAPGAREDASQPPRPGSPREAPVPAPADGGADAGEAPPSAPDDARD